jgi:hypothetical protein
MPLKGEVRNKYMRDYMRRKRAAERAGSPKRATTKPAADLAALAQAKARIAELQQTGADAAAENAALKAELARERSARASAEAKHSKPVGADVDDEDQSYEAAAAGPMGKRVFKLVLRLDTPNDHEALLAARKLVRELKANGSDLRVLANALETEWEKQQKAKPAPPPNIDFSAVETAVKNYAADKTTVRYNTMWRALVAEVPVLDDSNAVRAGRASHYVRDCLRRLGFTASSSGLTWHRS